MGQMMSLYLLGFMVVASICLVTYSLWPKSSDKDEAIKRRMMGKSGRDAVAEIRQQAKVSVAKQMMKKVAPLAVRPVMPKNAQDISKIRMKLASAGFRDDHTVTMFLASKTVIAILVALVLGIYVVMKGDTIGHGLGLAVFGAALGFMAPNLWLMMAASKRGEQIRYGIPDSLDLMVISVEAGLALDAAIQRVGDEMRAVHPMLAEELQIVTLESQMGIPRAEALTNLASRTAVPELRSLVAIINQAERFGTSIARALRSQADAMRVKRRQAAEERAQKTTVKLMAPLILFIFPAILVVLAGPAALKVIATLSGNPAVLGGG